MLGVLQSNRENVLHALHGLHHHLAEIESALAAENFSQLEIILNQSRSSYQTLIGN
jgi:hypothetical protein